MKVLLIDDHGLFREGLSLLIQQQAQELGVELPICEVLEAGSMREALEVARRHPDLELVFLDLGLPDGAGAETVHAWRQYLPLVPVVVLSADDRTDTVMSAIDAGAVGFIPKTARWPDMRQALETVLSGGVYLPSLPPAANDSGFAVLDDDADVAAMGLSSRQLDVLRLLVEGKSNKDICRELGLSESTVKTHLAAIFRKLEVTSRTQAVVAVARRGWRLKFSSGSALDTP